MGLKKRVMELLSQGCEHQLAELAAADRRAVRPLLGRLWDPDDGIRAVAARAVGMAAAAHPELGSDLVRRLLWNLNDESATNGVFGLPALGEIGRHAPAVIEPFIGPMVSLAWDDGLRVALLAALAAVAGSAPELVAPHLDELARFVDEKNPPEREAHLALVLAVENRESRS
jgi:hypothetical protein